MKKIVMKTVVNYAKVPNPFHLEIQKKFPSRVQENKKKYNRKKMKDRYIKSMRGEE